MKVLQKISDWLERRWVAPAYGGWVLAGFSVCFLGAAFNTMTGWLYVISGVSFALLGIAATLPVRSLKGIRVKRLPIQPISAGDRITVELDIANSTQEAKTLLQIQDTIPFVLGKPVQTPVETIPPQGSYRWVYDLPTERRGVYRWHSVWLRTATPLGLFWCRRERNLPATAIVYPTVLPLTICPLIDEMGQEESPQFYSRDRNAQAANQDLTRSLRPYRWGDPFRLVHWRTSARYGQLRVRELEVVTGGKEVIICLDSAYIWREEEFEQAVIAAASLYFYAIRSQLNAKIWTAASGLIQGNRVVLEILASVNSGEEPGNFPPPDKPLIWLTQNPLSIDSLTPGSRWMLWPKESSSPKILVRDFPGTTVQPEKDLQSQLQSYIR